MANLIKTLILSFSFKQIINFVFVFVPLFIIGISIIKIIKYFNKDELFILSAVHLLICLIVMMIPILYNTSSLLVKSHNYSSFENRYIKEDELVFDYSKTEKAEFLKKVYIGDSRTVGMYNAIYGGNDNFISITNDQEIWYAKVSAGYNWFINDAIKQIDYYLLKGNYEFIFLMGANDLYNAKLADNYIGIIGDYANNYSKSSFIYVSVNPINDTLSLNHGYSVINKNVVDFNNNLIQSINNLKIKNISYCDTYKSVISDYVTGDGLHYNAQTYKKIYNIIDTCL